MCSSSSDSSGRSQVAMSRVKACRWPPDRLPMALSSRSSSPRLSWRTRSRISALREGRNAQARPRGRPRRAARARFSEIVMFAAVPLKGFWKTRPISLARRCSGQRVTSRSARRIRPSSTRNVPATAFKSVDLPEPFVPTTTTNEPAGINRLTSRKARTSLGVWGERSSRRCESQARLSSLDAARRPQPLTPPAPGGRPGPGTRNRR